MLTGAIFLVRRGVLASEARNIVYAPNEAQASAAETLLSLLPDGSGGFDMLRFNIPSRRMVFLFKGALRQIAFGPISPPFMAPVFPFTGEYGLWIGTEAPMDEVDAVAAGLEKVFDSAVSRKRLRGAQADAVAETRKSLRRLASEYRAGLKKVAPEDRVLVELSEQDLPPL